MDSHDLPLNVSREILQESRIVSTLLIVLIKSQWLLHIFANHLVLHLLKVRIMKKRLVRKAFDMILGISMSDNREV